MREQDGYVFEGVSIQFASKSSTDHCLDHSNLFILQAHGSEGVHVIFLSQGWNLSNAVDGEIVLHIELG